MCVRLNAGFCGCFLGGRVDGITADQAVMLMPPRSGPGWRLWWPLAEGYGFMVLDVCGYQWG